MPRQVTECEHTNRAHQAKGLCAQCYFKQYDAKRKKRKDPSEYADNYRKPPHLPVRFADCHPDRDHWARGLCGPCYHRERVNSVRATCHPDRPHLANGLCSRCVSKQRYDTNPERARQMARESHARSRVRNRAELLDAYGGRCSCAACPETNPVFLTLEHVNRDGGAHRRQVGSHSYADLRRRGWPQDGYTLLCWNCNAMTRFGKTCPHLGMEA